MAHRNPARLQNMILTVGPGTPAAVADLTVEPRSPVARRLLDEPADGSSSSSSSSSSSEEEEEEAEEPKTPNATHSRSGSSASSTSSPKRTLSDRMKPQEETRKHDMNLSSTSGEEEGTEEEAEAEEKIEAAEEEKTSNVPEGQSPEEGKESGDEEMMGYSDVEAELTKQEEDKETDEANEKDAEMPRPLTDRERFFLEINEAEEHRMQFSEESNDEENEEALDEDEHQRPPGGLVETTDEDGEDDLEDDDEEMADFREMAAEWFAMEQAQEEEDAEESDDEEEEEEDSEDEDTAAARIIIRRRLIERSVSPTRNRNGNNQRTMKPALRHGGCINTAAWLQAGWRLSTVASDHCSTSYNANHGDFDLGDSTTIRAISSDDCPTQLVTSGDDRLVKFWDVRHAMGSANPLPWGRNTHCPFAYTPECEDVDGVGYKYKWKELYRKQKAVKPWQIFGNVLPLATLQTGHRANVFHVTPMWQQPGKIATCGADGYLRMGDIEVSSGGDSTRSSIVISPEYFDDTDHIMSGLFGIRPGMCFSHHFLNANVGLLCSERGLRKFDTRLPPRQQERRALLGGSSTLCKACAVWTVSSASSVEEVDSTYVFGESWFTLFPLFLPFKMSSIGFHHGFSGRIRRRSRTMRSSHDGYRVCF
jgi:hypothetical protein